jgi:hypothetical protein
MENQKMQEILLWRLGEVDGELHTLVEVEEKYGVKISEFLQAEREFYILVHGEKEAS